MKTPSEKREEKDLKQKQIKKDEHEIKVVTDSMRRLFASDDGKRVLKYLHTKYGIYKSPLAPNKFNEFTLASTAYFQGQQDVYKDIRKHLTDQILIEVEF